MSRPIPIIVISVVVAALSAATYGFYNQKTKLEDENQRKTNTIAVLTEQGEIKDEKIELLEERIEVLNDSISTLNERIDVLEKDIDVYKKSVRTLEGRIRRREKKIKDIEAKITRYARSDKDYRQRIAELENQKRSLIQKVETLSTEKVDNQAIANQKEKQSAAEKIRRQKLEKARNIVDNTRIIYEKIRVREEKSTGDIRKLKKSKKWRYTTLHFHIQHEDGNKPILDEDFAVLIRDMDTDRILPFNEGNPKFPGKMHENGVKVSFNGNMIMLNYLNTELKKGENYAVEIYYILDGKKYRLPSATKQIVKDGKVVSI